MQLIESVNSDNLGHRINTDIYFFTTSEVQDETAHAESSHQDLHCYIVFNHRHLKAMVSKNLNCPDLPEFIQ